MKCLACASLVAISIAFGTLWYLSECARAPPEPSQASTLEIQEGTVTGSTSFGPRKRVADIPKHIHQTWKISTVPNWASNHVHTWKSKNPQVHLCLFITLLSVCAWTRASLSVKYRALVYTETCMTQLTQCKTCQSECLARFPQILHWNQQCSISIPFIRTLKLTSTFERGIR